MKNLFLLPLLLLRVVSLQGQSTTMQQLEAGLSSQKLSVSDVLTNPAYMNLHQDKAFRSLIKKFAKPEKTLLVNREEAGTHITVNGIIRDKNRHPVANTLVYVYQTDNKGLYFDANQVSGRGNNRELARLFGYFRTLNNGRFSFKTIHPQGYPDTDIPQHIHFEVFSTDGNMSLVTELLFDDDNRLSAAKRKNMSPEDGIIATKISSVNGPLYNYEINLK